MKRRLPPLALVYHGVADVPIRRDVAGLFTRPSAFVRHVSVLRSWGFRLVTLGELARRAAEGEAAGLAALTFDDGLADNLHTLVPILHRLGAPATVFVVSSWSGEPHPDAPWAPTLSHAEVRLLAGAGVEIGSHSMTHRDLSALPYEQVRADFSRSRHELEELLDRPVRVATFPFGRASEETSRACRDAGFSAACRISGEGSWDDPWNLPRQDMNNGAGLVGLWLKRDDRYEPLMRLRPGWLARGASRRLKAMAS